MLDLSTERHQRTVHNHLKTLLMCAFLLLPSLHNWFVTHVKEHARIVVRLQKLRCGPLDRLAAACILLGQTRSYLMILPLIAWNIDLAIGRKLMLLWALGLYIANCLKGLLLLPGPRFLNDRVVSLDRVVIKMANVFRRVSSSAYHGHSSSLNHGGGGHGSGGLSGGSSLYQAERFGLPCSKSYSAVLLPCYLLLLTTPPAGTVPACGYYSVTTLATVAVTWSVLLALSGMYLGMQTPTDVVTGAMLGALLLVPGVLLGHTFDFALTAPYSYLPFIQPFAWWLLLLAYPPPVAPSSSFTETAAVVGTAAGVGLGSAWCFAGIWLHPQINGLSADGMWIVGLRSAIGLSSAAACEVICLRFFSSWVPPLKCLAPRLSRNLKAVLQGSKVQDILLDQIRVCVSESCSLLDVVTRGKGNKALGNVPSHLAAKAAPTVGVRDKRPMMATQNAVQSSKTKEKSLGMGGSKHNGVTSSSMKGALPLGSKANGNLLGDELTQRSHGRAYSDGNVSMNDYEQAVPVYFLTYLCVGLIASFFIPLLIQCLQI